MRPHGMDCPEDTELKNHSEMPSNQDIQPKQRVNIYPGCKLYHRANYIRDKDNSLGEIIVKNFDGKYITCSTRKGEMLFNISALGTFLSLSKDALTDEIVIDGQLDIPLEELVKYKWFDKDDKVFSEEKTFFLNIRQKLEQKFNALSGKSNLVKYEFNDFSDSFNETSFKRYSDYENELVIIGDLLKKPYFGRIDLSENEQQRIYVADRSIPDIGNMIHDWREPICQVYYLDNPVLYNKYGVTLIRNFDIHNGSFCGYFDRYVKNEDDENTKVFDNFLLSILKKRRENEKIQDIIQTIQDTQYEIICDDFTKNLVIQGCAGSGKTMILMHRLSYAIYNRKDLAENSIKIISQNRNLNLELSELAQKLQLNNIDRITLHEYYDQLIQRVFIENKVYEIPHLQVHRANMCPDNEIAITKLNDIYQTDFGLACTEFELNKKDLEVLGQLIQSFSIEKLDFQNENRTGMVIKFFKHLQSLNVLLKETVILFTEANKKKKRIKEIDFTSELKSRKDMLTTTTSKGQKYFNETVNLIQENIAQSEKLIEEDELKVNKIIAQSFWGKIKRNFFVNSKEISQEDKNVKEIKKNIERRQNSVRILKNILDKLETIKTSFNSDNFYIQLSELKFPPEEVNQIEQDSYLNLIFKFKFDLCQKKFKFDQAEDLVYRIKEYMNVLKGFPAVYKVGNDEVTKFMISFQKLNNIICSLENFQSKTDNSYIRYIWHEYIKQFKIKHDISINKRYQFELHALLSYLNVKFGSLYNSDRYLFIDEGQDFLEKEISVLVSINKSPTINIFGDFAQKTRNLNMDYYFDKASKEFGKYELDANYRNCKEITEYINKKCNTAMQSLGLTGIVKVIKLNNLTSTIFSDMQSMKILIVKNSNALTKLSQHVLCLNNANLNIVFDSDSAFAENKLNVLNIISSKGLEFKEVIVFNYDLTDNELYIACSRALEKLIVIEDT